MYYIIVPSWRRLILGYRYKGILHDGLVKFMINFDQITVHKRQKRFGNFVLDESVLSLVVNMFDTCSLLAPASQLFLEQTQLPPLDQSGFKQCCFYSKKYAIQ